VQRFKDEARFPLVGISETQGRELENMLPVEFYRDTFGRDINHQSAISCLGATVARAEPDFRFHIDFKKGLSLGDIITISEAPPEGQFWRQKLSFVSSTLRKQFMLSICWTSQTCAAPDACECKVINGNRSKILRSFCEYAERKGLAAMATNVDVDIRNEWERVGRFVASWCCGRDKVRS
jgi:hypothetical protein